MKTSFLVALNWFSCIELCSCFAKIKQINQTMLGRSWAPWALVVSTYQWITSFMSIGDLSQKCPSEEEVCCIYCCAPVLSLTFVFLFFFRNHQLIPLLQKPVSISTTRNTILGALLVLYSVMPLIFQQNRVLMLKRCWGKKLWAHQVQRKWVTL